MNAVKITGDTWFSHFPASTHALSEKMWSNILANYEASSRHYHTIVHIATMLQMPEKVGVSVENKFIFDMAVIFHDVVYNALQKDNEEQSALYAGQSLGNMGVDESLIQPVQQMIMATKKHFDYQGTHSDTLLLLDCDLATLGLSLDAYLQYSKQIRNEYALIPAFIYRSKRKEVLEHFLSQPVFFRLNVFAELFEKQARSNLAHEIATLSE